MATPPFVHLPAGVRKARVGGIRRGLAALVAAPVDTVRGCALLVPGFTGSKEDFIALLPLLREAGWHVTAIDQRGQYESPGPDDEAGYHWQALAADVIAVAAGLRTELGCPVHLVGHSLGGQVCREAVLAAAGSPEDEGLFASLTLMSSGPAEVPAHQIGPLDLLREFLPRTDLDLVWQFKERRDRELGFPAPSPEVHAFLRVRFVSNNPHGLRAMAGMLRTAEDRVAPLRAYAQAAGLPILVLFGDSDDVWSPGDQSGMARALRARTAVLPHCGHSPATEHPAWTAALLEGFWSDCRGERPHVIGLENSSPSGIDVTGSGHDRNVTKSPAGTELRAPLPAGPAAARVARRMLARQAEAWGYADVIDDLQLVTSELVTNALRYAGGPVELRMRVLGARLRIEVLDAEPQALPEPRHAPDDDPHGRGLNLVIAVSADWGVDRTPDGKLVWAELAAPLG